MAVDVHIEKRLPGFTLKVSFTTQGSLAGILGASGSGKSMTLRCIAGIQRPDKGRIVVNGRTLFDSEKKIDLKPQKRRVGYLFQNYALFPTMTVEENMGCGYLGKDKNEKKEKIRAFLERYQLQGLEKRLPSQLSGGQQQRVALARMMMGAPDLILLDEPFSALDGPMRDLLQRDMQGFLEDYSGDMLMVTHNRDEIFKFCRELTVLCKGRSLVWGETKSLFQRPVYLEAARITGCKNFSRIRPLDSRHLEALDWGLTLAAAEEIPQGATHVGIRGHWMVPVTEEKDNSMEILGLESVETTFEHQYLVRNKAKEGSLPLWWMCPKTSFGEVAGERLPKRLYLPPEHLMFLREEPASGGRGMDDPLQP